MIKLRQYQTDIAGQAANIIKSFGLVYLAMQPRTGKTITALQTCVNLGMSRVLFVTKKKAIEGIKQDCKHYPQLAVTVVNYESLHHCAAHNSQIVVCDEAHSCGAFPKASARQKVARQIVGKLPVIFLSGTPTPESFSQIYHQLQISAYSPYRNYINFYKWAAIYVKKKIIHVYNREVNDYSNADGDRIKKETEHLFISYTQEEAGFDIAIDEKILIVPMPENLKADIATLKKHKVLGNIIADTAVKEMSKVHQMSSGSVIDENGEYFILSDYKAVFLKSNFEGRRIAIFYKFKSELAMLCNIFANEYTTDAHEFQSGGKRIYLGQFISSREGVRLDMAEAIIFFNIDFSALSYLQARERIISKERTRLATLYWLFSDCGIEQKIYKVVKNKENFTTKHYVREQITS